MNMDNITYTCTVIKTIYSIGIIHYEDPKLKKYHETALTISWMNSIVATTHQHAREKSTNYVNIYIYIHVYIYIYTYIYIYIVIEREILWMEEILQINQHLSISGNY